MLVLLTIVLTVFVSFYSFFKYPHNDTSRFPLGYRWAFKILWSGQTNA